MMVKISQNIHSFILKYTLKISNKCNVFENCEIKKIVQLKKWNQKLFSVCSFQRFSENKIHTAKLCMRKGVMKPENVTIIHNHS